MNLPFWLELAVRSGVLLLAGQFLRRLTRHSTAAFRHRLLFALLLLLAALPLLALVLPAIPLPTWSHAATPGAYVTVEEISRQPITASAPAPWNSLLILWAAGAFAAFLPLCVGCLSICRVARRASAFPCADVPTHVRVLISSDLQVPVTFGVFRPKILLPSAALNWPLSRLKAVLAHELAHIRRHDVAAQIAAHCIAALWWFQPLAWWTRHQLRAESELAADAEALQSGLRASDYAAELLAIAQQALPGLRLSSSAIGMVRGDLEDRVTVLLHPPSAALRRAKTYLAGLLLAAVTVAASAADFQPNIKGGSMLKRTILSALLTTAGLSAATVSGYIHDPAGNAIADAKVSLFNPENSAREEAITGLDGKFSLTDPGPGEFILRAEKPGLTTIFRAFNLQADGQVDRTFTMTAEGEPAMPDALDPPTSDQPKQIKIGGKIAQNNLITKITPTYPISAKKAHIQGTVQIDTTISKEGVPLELRVVSSPSDDISESALEAVRQWRYRPTLLNGEPIQIETTIIVNYTLSK